MSGGRRKDPAAVEGEKSDGRKAQGGLFKNGRAMSSQKPWELRQVLAPGKSQWGLSMKLITEVDD